MIRFLSFIFGIVLLFGSVIPAAHADDLGDLGLTNTAIQVDLVDPGTQPFSQEPIGVVVGRFISLVLGLIGLVFFVLIVYAGIMWMTAEGSEGKVGQAKSILTQAVWGFFIVAGAYTITNFVTTFIERSALRV